MFADLIVLCILAMSPVAIFGALCALNAARIGHTRPSIALSFFGISCGWGAIFFGALDYLMAGATQSMPIALLFGVAALAGGNASLYLANRRDCQCSGCPGQRLKRWGDDAAHGRHVGSNQ